MDNKMECDMAKSPGAGSERLLKLEILTKINEQWILNILISVVVTISYVYLKILHFLFFFAFEILLFQIRYSAPMFY